MNNFYYVYYYFTLFIHTNFRDSASTGKLTLTSITYHFNALQKKMCVCVIPRKRSIFTLIHACIFQSSNFVVTGRHKNLAVVFFDTLLLLSNIFPIEIFGVLGFARFPFLNNIVNKYLINFVID